MVRPGPDGRLSIRGGDFHTGGGLLTPSTAPDLSGTIRVTHTMEV